MIDVLFLALMTLSCGYAVIAGPKEGRIVSCLFLGAWLGSFPASYMSPLDRQAIDIYLFGIDLIMLAGLIAVARRTQFFWPLWVIGFHLASLSMDVVCLAVQGWQPIIYDVLHAFWSVPELLIMPIGIHLDRNAGLLQDRPDILQ